MLLCFALSVVDAAGRENESLALNFTKENTPSRSDSIMVLSTLMAKTRSELAALEAK